MLPQLPQPARYALQTFPVVFSDETIYASPPGAAWASGRVNLIGEHTDYNDGLVLPVAIDRVAAFAGRTRNDRNVRLWSTHFDEYAQFSLDGLPENFIQQRDNLPRWARYVLGVVTELARERVPIKGFDSVIDGNVPLGGGMSSSAALEVATAHACALFSQGRFAIGNQRAMVTLRPMRVAELCQRAEQIASGVMCGILDQAASCLGQSQKAMLLDCRSLEYSYLPFDAPDLLLVVIDTGVRRDLASSAYNERRQQCEKATSLLRDIILRHEPRNEAAQTISALRDITIEQFEHYGAELPDVLRRRAGYVITENARVLRTVKLLESGNFEEIGQLLWLSHEGLRDDYEVSCVELDTLVDIAHNVEGILGARMMGGGFGGCTINLVRNDTLNGLRQTVEREYPVRTGKQARIDVCHVAGGPGSSWIQ